MIIILLRTTIIGGCMDKILILIGVVCLWATPSLAKEDKELACMVEAIYFEARSESLHGKIAVGTVILNRVKSDYFPHLICEVVHQAKYFENRIVQNQCQFSYYCDGKKEIYSDVKALLESINVAQSILSGVEIANFECVTHYHADYVMPYWAFYENIYFHSQIGRHLFYETETC